MPEFKLNPKLDPETATTYEFLHLFLQMDDKHLEEEYRFKRFFEFISGVKTEKALSFQRNLWFPEYILLRGLDTFECELMNYENRNTLIQYKNWINKYKDHNNPHMGFIYRIYQGIYKPYTNIYLRSTDRQHMKTICQGMTSMDRLDYECLGDRTLRKMWGGEFQGEVSIQNTEEGYEWYITHTAQFKTIDGRYTLTPLENQEPYRIYFDPIKTERVLTAYDEDCRALTLSAV